MIFKAAYAQTDSFQVYPNPFTESFNLNLTTSSQDVVELVVYDMTGKLIEKLPI